MFMNVTKIWHFLARTKFYFFLRSSVSPKNLTTGWSWVKNDETIKIFPFWSTFEQKMSKIELFLKTLATFIKCLQMNSDVIFEKLDSYSIMSKKRDHFKSEQWAKYELSLLNIFQLLHLFIWWLNLLKMWGFHSIKL